jgi:sodium-dependent phosphate transporter
VGGTAGVGLVEGRKGVNWKLLLKTFGAWIFTLIVAGTLSAALFSAGAFAPSIPMARQIQAYEDGVLGQSKDILEVSRACGVLKSGQGACLSMEV